MEVRQDNSHGGGTRAASGVSFTLFCYKGVRKYCYVSRGGCRSIYLSGEGYIGIEGGVGIGSGWLLG